MDRQCSSCGGFCKKSGCERENVKPEQEPVGYLCENAVGHKYFRWKKPPSTYKPIALYTAHASPQRIWQGLTDEEILEEYRQSYGDDGNLTDVYFARAIEQALKEKNNG
jgi:hypothetical protein